MNCKCTNKHPTKKRYLRKKFKRATKKHYRRSITGRKKRNRAQISLLPEEMKCESNHHLPCSFSSGDKQELLR